MTAELAPHQRAVLDAVFDDLPEGQVVSQVALGRAKGELKRRLTPYGAGLGDGQEVHVDRMSLPAALACPASNERDPFAWTAPNAARSVGLPAVASIVRGGDRDPLDAVERSIAEAIDQSRSLGLWLAELDDVGRAAVSGAALTWCARALVAVPWGEFPSLRFGIDAVWHRPLGSGSLIAMRGRPDATVLIRRHPVTEQVLLVLGAFDEAIGRLDALTVACKLGRAPLRVVFVQASSGRVDRLDVDVDLLDAAIDDAERAVAALLPAAQGHPAAEIPSGRCWSCDRRDRCVTGTAWMRAQPRRVAGIPIG